MADGQVVFEITADGKHVKADIKEVTKAIQAESKNWDAAANTATKGIESSFASMAGSIAAKLGAAGIGAAILGFGKAAVEAASDLSEVQNVVDTVFGDGAATIDAWAKKAGQQFGLTETQAKKFTSTLGAMMKSSGMAGDEIISMSTDLAGLAADMASFYNLDFEEAFDKIRSGISGQTMPLKQLGIDMSVANLEAFALAQGLEKTFSQMDQGEQTMLRYQYLMQATSDAQGDFAKTSDGFANAQRRIQSSIDSIKTSVGTILLPTLSGAVAGIAGFLAGIAAEMMPERTVMDEFNDINVDTAGKMSDLQATYDKAKAIIDLLAEIEKTTVTLNDGSEISLGNLFGDLGEIEANGGNIEEYIASLGLDVEFVVGKYNEWKEATRQLTSLVPSLTSVINSETGAIDGGTEALQRNLDEWKAAEEKKLAWAAYYAKARALEEAKAEQYKYQFDADAKAQLRKNFEAEHQELARLYKEKGGLIFRDYADFGISREEIEAYKELVKESTKAEASATNQANAYAKAEEEVAAGKQALIEKYGEEEQAATDAGDAAEEYGGKSEEAWKSSVAGAKEAADAINAVIDYYKGVRDATEQAVNSTLKGFAEIKLAGDDLRKKQMELGVEYTKTEKEHAEAVKSLQKKYGEGWLEKAGKDYEKLSDKEKEAYNALAKLRNQQNEVNAAVNQYKPEGMMQGLESQKQFMEDYIKNLDQLKEWGISDEMLASLADGSAESAEYLKGLVEGGPEAASAVDELYQTVQEKKKGFTDALTDQKLTVDETYNAMVEKAKEAVEGLDLGDEAAEAMGDTVIGIAQGISANVPAVSAAVDSLIEALSRLQSLGFGFGFNGGSFDFSFPLDGSNAKGLDYVPFDGYLSELHEGEGILTAEENRVWQRFKNGGASTRNVDYDALGGVMRDNIQAGGNVYLDGRTVGRVISGIQGNQFRSLQRSGFQQ